MSINKTDLYYLWLGVACNFEPNLMEMCSANLLSDEIENASTIYNSSEYIYALYENREKIQAVIDKTNFKNRIHLNIDLEEPTAIARECQKLGIQVITLNNKLYPNRLRNIYCPPKLLFVIGDIGGVDDALGISIVGTRFATETGISAAENIAYELASQGIIITSGMAKGIDRAAHIGALNAYGRTFAVLSGGVDIVYPAMNRDIYEIICKSGAIISERPPHCIGQPRFYQQRNRILTGLSLGVIITEGKLNSGTSITARHALENNRDIFAIPGDINSIQSQLPNSLIKDGAALIQNASDILKHYKYLYPELEIGDTRTEKKSGPLSRIKNILSGIKRTDNTNTKSSPKSETETKTSTEIKIEVKSETSDIKQRTENFFNREAYLALSDGDKSVLKIIEECAKDGILIDELAEKSGLEIKALNSKILMWQIKGLIVQGGGGKVFLKI